VDPTLHRNRVRWDELDVVPRLRDMAEDTWERMQGLAAPGGDTDTAQAGLDAVRVSYVALYREAEAISQSSVTAAKPRRGVRPPAPPTLRVRLARRVPVRYRRRLRRMYRALRA
jgi:hypothetical protein